MRRLTTKDQFVALLFGQFAGATSLREIEAGLVSQSARLYHLGAHGVARSTLAEANARRPAALYGELFAHMAACAGRGTRRQLKDAVCILDATRAQVPSLRAGWADAVCGHRAIKLHVAYDPHADAPLKAEITGQGVSGHGDAAPADTVIVAPSMGILTRGQCVVGSRHVPDVQ